MAWEELDFDKPHLAYMIIGGFTSLFMLCSLFIKEKLYIGEATIATIVGVIFGPHAANLFNPLEWGNTDKITLELSRIVLVVQCFAVGVELPKAYMERHWRSVLFLLVPIMTFGWLITSLIIWVCVSPLTWLESLAIAACVTATDPVLASSVVGKGKFAKRVPKHLRDILSAESGCNDGMAFPFIYLSYYLIHYHLQAGEVTFHWIVILILYECVFGAVYGFTIGYIARHAIKYAERKSLIDRDSFLVFYFVLALFCSGSAAGLGLDDLLVGFAAGVGFSNDGWFVEKTEESHVSNVIDLLLNLSYFVYLGAIIPWEDYNNAEIGLTPWRLVLIAIFVVLFRRIPAMLAFKPLIPDVKNWREALFAGHFGPIGVGAIFAVILLRAELENNTTQPEPEANLPGELDPNFLVIQTMWPIVTFLVIASILVHGSSIAVFTLGKRINTLTLTMSYTQGNDPNWMDRLPRIASRGRSMSRNSKLSEDSSDEKADFQPGTLGPFGVPRNFLRRQKEDDDGGRPTSRATKKKKRYSHTAGGPIDESAFGPQPFWDQRPDDDDKDAGDEGEPPDMVEAQARDDENRDKDEKERANGKSTGRQSPEIEAYREGDQMVVEDEEGNVLETRDIGGESPSQIRDDLLADVQKLRSETGGEHAKSKHHPHDKNEGEDIEQNFAQGVEHPRQAWKKWLNRGKEKGNPKEKDNSKEKEKPQPHRGPAQAYQYGDKIIVEDADGEVVKTYDIPRQAKPPKQNQQAQQKNSSGEKQEARPNLRKGLTRMGTWTGLTRVHSRSDTNAAGQAALAALAADNGEGPSSVEKIEPGQENVAEDEDEDDRNLRFRVHGTQRRMSKQDFIKQIQAMDPRVRVEAVEQTDASEGMKQDVRDHAKAEGRLQVHGGDSSTSRSPKASRSPGGRSKHPRSGDVQPKIRSGEANRSASQSSADDMSDIHLVDSHGREIPIHDVKSTLARASEGQPETAAQRRRRLAREGKRSSQGPEDGEDEDSDDDGTERVPPPQIRRSSGSRPDVPRHPSDGARIDDEETAAERRRRLAALGEVEEDSESDDDGQPRIPKTKGAKGSASSGSGALLGIQEPPRALLRERAPPQSPIAEEDEGSSPGESGSGSGAAIEPPDSPRSPGIRFADMPRGEGRGRTRRFGRTMGMRRG